MTGKTVAVVGGGAAGVLATRELLRCSDDRVVLIEPDAPGGGLAYGSARPWHLLNSRAGAMSADPADPSDFARWAECSPASFQPRATYGRYLSDVFARTALSYGDRLEVVQDRAVRLASRQIHTEKSGRIAADEVVVATGNPAAAQPFPLRDHPDYIADPWRPGVLESIPSDVPVLLVGAGLTAVDVVLTLTADGNRDAPVTAVSRRGQLPLSHISEVPPAIDLRLAECRNLRDLVRAVRVAAAGAEDWRAVVDGLRPSIDRIWTSLTETEQETFLRHLARPWECHRHRMAPSVGARVDALREEGRFEVRAGGIRSVTAPPAGGVLVELEAGVQWFGAVVNCAGPGRLPASAGAFVNSLLNDGHARIGPHGLGLDIDVQGRIADNLWLIGPLRRGRSWETTAVPEIRSQARALIDRHK